MRNISTFNKFFLLFCAALFVLLVFAAPHDKDSKAKQNEEFVSNSE